MLYGKPYRFHHALTGRGSVAGVNINVSAPETFWAVIGVAISLDRSTTMGADEIFNMALEFFVHWSVLIFLPCASLSNVRFRLGEKVAARSKSQSSRTNSLKSVLYALPMLSVVPCAGSNASRTDFFLLLRSSDKRNFLGFKIPIFLETQFFSRFQHQTSQEITSNETLNVYEGFHIPQ